MATRTSDMRTVRTKKLLRHAFLELVEEKGLDNITVSDLTARAEVNRGTFYLHYKDVADFNEQFQSEVLKGWSDIARDFNFLEMVGYAGKEEPYPGLVAIFEYCDRNAHFCRAMLGPKGDPTFALRIKEMMQAKIQTKLDSLDPEHRRLTAPPDFVMAYMSSANIGLIQHWFGTGRRQSPREIAMIMTRIVASGPLAAFGIRPS